MIAKVGAKGGLGDCPSLLVAPPHCSRTRVNQGEGGPAPLCLVKFFFFSLLSLCAENKKRVARRGGDV